MDLLESLQRLGDAEHDDLEVAHDALAEIIRLRADVEINRLAHEALREARRHDMAERLALRAENEALRKAGQAVVDRWHTPNWKDAKPTAAFIHALEAALIGRGE